MQFLNEINRPHLVTSLLDPMVFTHFWCFNGHMMDFNLANLTYLEETTGPTVKLEIRGLEIDVPTGWYVLAVDRETSTVDSLPITIAAAQNHDLLLFSAEDSKPLTTTARVTGYDPSGVVYHPAVAKGSAMIHPCTIENLHGRSVFYGIVIGPHDLHRYVTGKTLGDLLT
jgi:hypothetical protein